MPSSSLLPETPAAILQWRLNWLYSLIEDTSECLLCNCHLLDTLEHAHAELIAVAASIAGGSEGQE